MELDWIDIEKILNNTASEKDVARFFKWLDESEIHRKQFQKMKAYNENCENNEYVRSMMRDEKYSPVEIIVKAKRTKKIRFVRFSISIAAALFAITFLIQYITTISGENFENIASNISLNEIVVKTDIGTVINLEELNAEVDMNSKTIAYKESDSIECHKIYVPIGKNFTLKLLDSTEIIINSDTEVEYPTKFDSTKPREIRLKGEAYFKVHKSKNPFIIKTNEGQIHVYGTEFNVKSLGSGVFETAVVNGLVGVTISEYEEVLLTKNQILHYDNGGKITLLEQENVSNYIQWIDNNFNYDEYSLTSILRDLSSWYGIEFICDKDIEYMKTTFFASRKTDIDELLKLIEIGTSVKFKKEKGGIYRVN